MQDPLYLREMEEEEPFICITGNPAARGRWQLRLTAVAPKDASGAPQRLPITRTLGL